VPTVHSGLVLIYYVDLNKQCITT